MTSERIPKSAQRTNPYVASADELRAVASAVLEHEKFGQTPAMLPSESEPAEAPGLLVLIDRSTCLAGADSQCGDLLNPWFDSFVSEELRKALAIANTEPQEIDLDGLPGTQVVSAAALDDIFSKGGKWPEFYATYSRAGYAQMSLPVLSADGQQALLYVGHLSHGLCGVGMLVLLERSESGWSVARKKEVWIS